MAEDVGLKQSLKRYAVESGAITERVYHKEMEIPIEDMKQFLDGIFTYLRCGTHCCKDERPFRNSSGSRSKACRKRIIPWLFDNEKADVTIGGCDTIYFTHTIRHSSDCHGKKGVYLSMAKGSARKKGKKWHYRFYVEDESGKIVQREFAGAESKS